MEKDVYFEIIGKLWCFIQSLRVVFYLHAIVASTFWLTLGKIAQTFAAIEIYINLNGKDVAHSYTKRTTTEVQ